MAPLRPGWLALALLGCGDATVPVDYRGEPAAQLDVLAQSYRPPTPGYLPEGPFRVALFWGPADADFERPDQLEEDPRTGVEAVLQRGFVFTLFDHPPETRLGILLAYRDDDGDGRRGPEERFIGAASGRGLVYAATALSAGDSPTGVAMPAGYHEVLLPLPGACGFGPSRMLGRVCNVPYGAPCAEDADCGVGMCLKTDVSWWPDGACAVALADRPSCAPIGAFLPAQRPSLGYIIRACAADADCGREGYRCDLGVGGCVPASPVPMGVGGPQTGPVFCGMPEPDVRNQPGPPM